MKKYFTYFKLRCLTNLQYRSAAIAGLLTQFFFGMVFIEVYIAFYSSGDGSVPISLCNLVNYMWLQQAFFSLVYPSEKDPKLFEMIKNGNLAYELVRPDNFYFKWYVKIYSKKIIAVLLRFAPVLLVAFILPEPYMLSLPPSIEYLGIFILAIFVSSILVCAIVMLLFIITMYTLDFRGSLSIFGVIIELFMGGTVPLVFFPDWLLKVANVLPFRFLGDFPFRVYSGAFSVSNSFVMLGKGLSWCVIVIAIGYYLCNRALKKAVIQGG